MTLVYPIIEESGEVHTPQSDWGGGGGKKDYE